MYLLHVQYDLHAHNVKHVRDNRSMFKGVMKRFWMQLNASLALFLAPGSRLLPSTLSPEPQSRRPEP